MVHSGYEATAVIDAVHASAEGARGRAARRRTEGPMAPEIPLDRQRPARIRLLTPRRAASSPRSDSPKPAPRSRRRALAPRSAAARRSQRRADRARICRGVAHQRAQHAHRRRSRRPRAVPASAAGGRRALGRIGDDPQHREGQAVRGGDARRRCAIPCRRRAAPVCRDSCSLVGRVRHGRVDARAPAPDASPRGTSAQQPFATSARPPAAPFTPSTPITDEATITAPARDRVEPAGDAEADDAARSPAPMRGRERRSASRARRRRSMTVDARRLRAIRASNCKAGQPTTTRGMRVIGRHMPTRLGVARFEIAIARQRPEREEFRDSRGSADRTRAGSRRAV